MRKLVTTAALLLLIVFPNYALAQVNATVTGTVADASGAFIPGVEVTAKNVNTGITDTRLSNEGGSYVFQSLQAPGTYTVSAVLPGFQTATFNNVVLTQGQQVRLNFSLQVASAAQNVEVTIAADTVLATTSSSVGNVLAERAVTDLPLSSRNVLDLVQTTPGVVTVNGAFGNATVSFGGTAASQVNTTRDGLTTNDGRYNDSNGAYSAIYTSPDMVEEVRISASNVDPALGRGSAQVQMRTRAGSNEFHGALFYTNNNSKFATNSYIQNLTGASRGYQNRNQFGGRVAGPIKQNKAFFFVLIDDQRFLEKTSVTGTVLTNPARQGIFRYLTEGATGAGGGTARQNGNAFAVPGIRSVDLLGTTLQADPVTGRALFMNSFNIFSDVRDPNRTRIDPIWFGPQYLTRMPEANDYTVGDGLNTAGHRWLRRHEGTDGATGASPNTNRNHFTTRIDYQISTSHKLTYTMSREKNWGVTGQTGLPDFPAGQFGDIQRVPDFYTLSYTATLSPTILNEFRFGLKRDTFQGTSPVDKGCCWGGKGENDLVDSAKEMRASFPQVDGQFINVGSGALGTGAYSPFGVASPRNSVSPFRQFSDVISFTKGAHSFQAGGEMDFTSSHQYNHGGQQTTRPNVTLGTGNTPVQNITTTNFPGLAPTNVTTAQNLLASMSGSVNSIVQQYFVNSPTQTDWTSYKTTFLFERDLHQDDWNFFFKDNWKVSKNLTLNLGVRYDKYGVPYDTFGLGGRFSGGRAGQGGEAALFGCSGGGFDVMFNPNVGCDTTKLTTTEFVGKFSPNPDKTIWGNDWNNWAPSVGFSYSVPWAGRTTVVRGGYGINYAAAPDFLGYSGNIGNLPGQTLNSTAALPVTYVDLSRLATANLIPVPVGTTKPFEPVPLNNRTAGITGYADKRVTPYVQSFNLSVQRELARNLTLDVSWIGNKASKLFSGTQLNETNIIENGILDAFNVTRAGGDAPLFDRMLRGLNVTGVGTVGTTIVNNRPLTGSMALRRLTTTNQFIANGNVGALADFFNTNNSFTGQPGGFLRNAGLPENYIVVNPQFGSVTLQGNNTNSTFHSFQTILTKRMSNSVYGQFSYTFGKSLGDTGVRDQRNRSISKGRVNLDRTHIYKANGTWDVPLGPNRRYLANAPGVVARIVEGWQISPVFSFQSGAPLSFTSGLSTIGFRSAGNNTADLVGVLPSDLGKVEKGAGFVQYFSGLSVKNATAPNFGAEDQTLLAGRFTNMIVVDSAGNTVFQNPIPGQTGNLAANLGFDGPPDMRMDVALTKRIRFAESKTFELRVDAVNILNKPIWGNPNTNINSANFGRITTATGTRQLTFNARVDF